MKILILRGNAIKQQLVFLVQINWTRTYYMNMQMKSNSLTKPSSKVIYFVASWEERSDTSLRPNPAKIPLFVCGISNNSDGGVFSMIEKSDVTRKHESGAFRNFSQSVWVRSRHLNPSLTLRWNLP